MRTVITSFVFLCVLFTLTSFLPTSTRVITSIDEKQKEILDDRDLVGQNWIKTEVYNGETWYTLYATNTSGECYCIVCEINIASTGERKTIRKNIPAWCNTKKEACKVISLKTKFTVEKIEAEDCL